MCHTREVLQLLIVSRYVWIAAWRLCRKMRALLRIRPASAVRVHKALLAELGGGSRALLLDASAHAHGEGLPCLAPSPLPDSLSDAGTTLLALARLPAALTSYSTRFCDASCVAAFHAAAGDRSRHEPELSLKYHLAVLQLHLSANARASAFGTASLAVDGGNILDVGLAARAWRLAHTLLVCVLLPSERLMSESRRIALVSCNARNVDLTLMWLRPCAEVQGLLDTDLAVECACVAQCFLAATAPVLDHSGAWNAGWQQKT